MKNINEMTDNELFDLKNELTMLLSRHYAEHKIGLVNSDVATIEERNAAMVTMHEIRLESWKRGFVPPLAEGRDKYIRWIKQGEENLEKALVSGNIVKIYNARTKIESNRDRLNWIDNLEVNK